MKPVTFKFKNMNAKTLSELTIITLRRVD
jgi:hypothetical protein